MLQSRLEVRSSSSPASNREETADAKAEQAHFSQRTSKSDLDFLEKEKIQSLVREVLRPLYRDGTITNDEYTSLNKRVSRVMYRHLYKEQQRKGGKDSGSESRASNRVQSNVSSAQLEHWKLLVKHYLNKELAKKTAAAEA